MAAKPTKHATHDDSPISFRPPRPVEARLRAHATATGQSVNGFMTAAVTARLDAEGAPPAPAEAPGTTPAAARPRRGSARTQTAARQRPARP